MTLSYFTGVAQIKVIPSSYNFQSLDQGDIRYADFEIKNNSSRNDYILRAEASSKLEILYSDKKIASESSIKMRVMYTPSSTGPFSERIKLYVGSLREPISITVKGNALFVPEDQDIACPSFGSEVSNIISFDAVITVIDSVTNEPLENAKLELATINQDYYSEKTNSKGQVKSEMGSGRYFIISSAEDYKTKEGYYYINKYQREIIIPLNRVRELIAVSVEKSNVVPELVENVIEVTDPEPVPEVVEVIDTVEEVEETVVEEVEPVDNGKLSTEVYASNNIVFLIDRSTSMRKFDRIELLKKAMINLLEPMRSADELSLITYATDVNVIMTPTPATNQSEIIALINSLSAEGETAGGKGIKKAYQVANKNFIPGGNNQIIIATDGAFKMGSDNKTLHKLVERWAKKGIILSVVAIKNPHYTEKGLKSLAQYGKGSYIPLESWEENSTTILEEIKLRSKKH